MTPEERQEISERRAEDIDQVRHTIQAAVEEYGYDYGSEDALDRLLADYDHLVEVARELTDRSPLVIDGETGDEWCHFCDEGPDYSKKLAVEQHKSWCVFAALRALIDPATPEPVEGEPK